MRILLLALLICLSLALPGLACEPSRHASQFTLQDYIDNADLIFVGTIVAGESPYSDSMIMTAEVEVESYLKGTGTAVLEISGFGYGPDCLSSVEIGEKFVFFAVRGPDGSLSAAYLSAHDAVLTANPENISTIQAITGQSIAPAPLPLPEQLSRFALRYWKWWAGTIIILIAFAIALKKRDFQGKPKMKRDQ